MVERQIISSVVTHHKFGSIVKVVAAGLQRQRSELITG